MTEKLHQKVKHGVTSIHDETTGLHLFTIEHSPKETKITDRNGAVVHHEIRHGAKQEPKEPA